MPTPGSLRGATTAPGYGTPQGFLVFDPVSKTAIQYIEALAGLSEFGIRFPYNNNSQTDLNVTGTTNLTARVNRYRDITIGATGVLNLQVSPCFLFARSITIVAGGIISIDGQGAPGGTGGAGEPTSGAGDAGNEGGSGDLGATDPADPPQYTFGISPGGGGGQGADVLVHRALTGAGRHQQIGGAEPAAHDAQRRRVSPGCGLALRGVRGRLRHGDRHWLLLRLGGQAHREAPWPTRRHRHHPKQLPRVRNPRPARRR